MGTCKLCVDLGCRSLENNFSFKRERERERKDEKEKKEENSIYILKYFFIKY